MQTLIYKRPISHFTPHVLPSNFASLATDGNQNFLQIHSRKYRYSFKTLTLCSAASSRSLSYGGWDDLQLSSGPVASGESNQLQDFLNFLGIGDKKYVFVYLFGFVCALAISRVKVSSIIVFPACAILFAIGLSVGLVKGGHLNESKSNGNKTKLMDETFIDSIQKLRDFGNNLNSYNAKILELRNDIGSGIKSNQVTMSDLEGYIDVLEYANTSFINAMDVFESCMRSILSVNQEKEVSSEQESSRRRKRSGEMGLNISQYFIGLFGGEFDGSKPGKLKISGSRDSTDVNTNNRKQENILASSVKQRNLNFARNGNLENKSAGSFGKPFDSTSKSPHVADNFADATTMENVVDEKRNVAEKDEADFDDIVYSDYNNTPKFVRSRFVRSQETSVKDYHDEIETMEYQNCSFDSINFSIRMNHTKTAASFSHHEKSENLGRNDSRYESTEEDRAESLRYSYRKEMRKDSLNGNVFGSSPSFVIGDDLEFNKYLTEANDLLKDAKRSLRSKLVDGHTEDTLHKSAILLSKALDMRPMSLLAVGQLGNTYLLHGELKLRISRDLRSLLAKSDPLSVEERRKVLDKFNDQFANKDEIMSALGGVCEECEKLLIKAGRKYKLALSIDGNDMRALYNWGLALSFRAQLVADIGPTAAGDADKVFLAAIDKFDAMMSKSNTYAPDALFRWGTVLQQRSRLRPRNSREKIKLLQQARRLYEDALDMDSGNRRLQEALSSCVSELDHWYRKP